MGRRRQVDLRGRGPCRPVVTAASGCGLGVSPGDVESIIVSTPTVSTWTSTAIQRSVCPRGRHRYSDGPDRRPHSRLYRQAPQARSLPALRFDLRQSRRSAAQRFPARRSECEPDAVTTRQYAAFRPSSRSVSLLAGATNCAIAGACLDCRHPQAENAISDGDVGGGFVPDNRSR